MPHPSIPSSDPPPRSPSSTTVMQNRAFIELSRVLASGDSAVLSTALPFVVHGAGLPSGAIFTFARDELSFVASEGVPLRLRAYLEEPAFSGAPDFLARRAVKQRRTVIDAAVFGADASAGAEAARDEATWQCGIAVPILTGGACIGVLLAGSRTGTIDGGTVSFLEAMANLLGAALGKPSIRGPVAGPSAIACAGCVALTSEALAGLGREVAIQHGLLREMCFRPGAPAEADALLSCSRAMDRSFRRVSDLVLHMPLSTCAHGKRPVSIPSVVDIAVHAARPALQSSRAELEVACAPACELEGDSDLLAIAIRHIVTNAAESFISTPDRSVIPTARRVVRICVRTEGPNAAVHVEDSGPGIPTDLRARVFDGSVTTKGPGRGLGLAVARHIVTAHGGWMELGVSELGGTRVSVLVPARPAALQALRTAPTLPQVPVVGARRTAPPGV